MSRRETFSNLCPCGEHMLHTDEVPCVRGITMVFDETLRLERIAIGLRRRAREGRAFAERDTVTPPEPE